MPLWRRVVLILIVVLLALVVFFTLFRTETVLVSGNTRYSDEDIKSICLDGALSNNTFLFTLFNRRMELSDMPYLDHAEAEMIDRNTIHISVEERISAGRIEYGGKIIYFDRNGNVLEIREKSDEQDLTAVLVRDHDPEVEMIETGDVIYEEEPEFLKEISVLSGLLLEADMAPDYVTIDEEKGITLVFGDTKIILGNDLFLEEKVARAAAILPDIQNTTGILHMEDYSENSKDIIFEQL